MPETHRVQLTRPEQESRVKYDQLLNDVDDAYDKHKKTVDKLEEFRAHNPEFRSSCAKIAAMNAAKAAAAQAKPSQL